MMIIPLYEVRQSDANRVGGKAAGLGELLAAGFPVPAGICLTTAAFHLALTPHRGSIEQILHGRDLRNPAVTEQTASLIAQQLHHLQLPAVIMSEIHHWLPTLNAPSPWLAVRSSATAEDRSDASYAGQYTTCLGVQGDEAIAAAILTCWRSFYSANALAQRAVHRTLGAGEGMGVLIQPLINAECAGVAFSVDPVQQRRDRLVIGAAWGLGVGVVDGAVDSDTVWVQRTNLQVERQHIVLKPSQMALDGRGDLHTVPVAAERQHAACLPPAWVERVAQFAVAAESHFGSPQDVEWAIAQDQIWVLQSRPLTALPPALRQIPPFPVAWADEAEARCFWQRTPLDELREVLLPLEQDHLMQLQGVREEACRLHGVERNQQDKYCNGYAYRRPIPMRWSEAERQVRRAAMIDLMERLEAQGWTAWDYAGPEIVKATERLRAFDPATADGPALAHHLQTALAVRCRHYILHPMMKFQPSRAFFNAYAALAGVTVEQAETQAWRLLDSVETPFTRLTDALHELACLARQDQSLAQLLATLPADLMERLRALPEATRFLAQLDQLLYIYGERTGDGWGSELTLRAPTWREQPILALRLLAPYLNSALDAPAFVRERNHQQRVAEVEALCSASRDPAVVAEFQRQWRYARKVSGVLEYHNHYMDQMSTGQLRHAVMAAARHLVAQGAITAPDEVFWLRFDEITAALQATNPAAALISVIATRQAEYAAWLTLEAPPFLGLPAAPLPARPPWQNEVTPTEQDEVGQLQGVGASSGQAQGRVRIALDPLALPILAADEILVTENVGPLWTPILPRLRGLVLESGSLGQHAAATAREYGVPAVIRVNAATRRLVEGEWISIDGTTGVITRS
jgi:pyruvate,water dikinase